MSHMIHFVFADEFDSYFPNAMLETDLNTCLWYQLRKKDYETVYFISSEGDRRKVTTYDADSSKLYLQNNSKWRSLFESKTAQVKEGFNEFYATKDDHICRWIVECAQIVRKKQAIILSLQDFCQLFGSESSKRLEQLAASPAASGGGMEIWLRVPLHEESAIVQILGEDSIFCKSHRGHMLCDSLSLLRSGEPKLLFEEMERLMSNSCHCLTVLDEEMIYNILLRHSFFHPEDAAEPEQLKEQATFLADWCSSESLQTKADLEWRLSGKNRYSALMHKLEDPSFYARVTAFAKGYRRGLFQISHSYPLREDALSLDIRKLRLPEECQKRFTEDQFRQFQKDVSSYWTHPRNDAVVQRIGKLVSKFNSTANRGDWTTANDLLTLLAFCGKHICLEQKWEERFKELCDDFEECVVAQSEEYFQEKRSYDEMKADLETLYGPARVSCEIQMEMSEKKYSIAEKSSSQKRTELKPLLQNFDININFDPQRRSDTVKKVNSAVEQQLQKEHETINRQTDEQKAFTHRLEKIASFPAEENPQEGVQYAQENSRRIPEESAAEETLPATEDEQKHGLELAYKKAYQMNYIYE